MNSANTTAMQGLECREIGLVRPRPDGGERLILDHVTARFGAGRVALISGPIGSGKTSLLHILATLLRPSEGEVLADGTAISRFSPPHRELWRAKAGLSFQGGYFLAELSVVENVMVPLVPGSSALSSAESRALEALDAFGVSHLARHKISALSGGERQRVSLARATAHQPRYLLLDEPSAHQDEDGVELIVGRLREHRDRGVTVVVVSHDLRLVESELADDLWRLETGHLEAAP